MFNSIKKLIVIIISFGFGGYFLAIAFDIIFEQGWSIFLGDNLQHSAQRTQLGDHTLREFIISLSIGFVGLANGLWQLFMLWLDRRQ